MTEHLIGYIEWVAASAHVWGFSLRATPMNDT